MSELVRWILAALSIIAGFVSIGISVAGVFRFRYVLNRMQTAAIIDTLGLFFLLLSLILLSWDWAYIPKLLLILAFQWVGSPIAAHMVSRMEVRTAKDLHEHVRIPEKEDEE